MDYITLDFVKENMPRRPDDAHKGTMGTLLNISGSYAMAGACVLSSLAALRSGVGLLKVALPKSIYPIVASSCCEAVYLPLDESEEGTVSPDSLDVLLDASKNANSVLLGCGLKLCDDTIKFVKEFVGKCENKLLVDADGINALARNIDILSSTKAEVVLTPHVKEMSRLTGLSVQEIAQNREEVAMTFAKNFSCTVVLKGKDTVVTDGDRLLINPTGNSGMAKGGSGDVLSGIIASFMAQGVSSFESACMGVYIHGLSGDIAAARYSKTAMLPSDILTCLCDTFNTFE